MCSRRSSCCSVRRWRGKGRLLGWLLVRGTQEGRWWQLLSLLIMPTPKSEPSLTVTPGSLCCGVKGQVLSVKSCDRWATEVSPLLGSCCLAPLPCPLVPSPLCLLSPHFPTSAAAHLRSSVGPEGSGLFTTGGSSLLLSGLVWQLKVRFSK